MTLAEFIRRSSLADPKSPFKYLTITERALRKAQAYARLIAEEFDDAEYYGYLLGDAKSDRPIVDDVLLAPDQKVTTGSCTVRPESVIKAGQEIARRGKKCLGWVHSHPRFKPYHSYIDDRNHEVVLHQVGPVNFVTLDAEELVFPGEIRTELKGDVLIISGANATLELRGDGPLGRITISQVKLKAVQFVSYAYSLVVTAESSETYAEIMLKRWGGCADEETMSYEVKLNILYEDADELRKEIKEKVSREYWTWGWRAWGEDNEEDEELLPREGQQHPADW
jgi:proteasome lid subunit RPN8/RPN11